MTLINTRPERTIDDIRDDQAAAKEFWRVHGHRRNIARLLERECYDYKLLMVDKEGREWAHRNDNDSDRRARRAARRAADPLANRRDDNLRPYVDAVTKAQMPPAALGAQAKTERVRSLGMSSAFFREMPNWSPLRCRRIMREQGHEFAHWLLAHPQYGPTYDGADVTVRPFEPWHYVAGQIRPAGMTPERALQIALDVLDAHDGAWDAPAQG